MRVTEIIGMEVICTPQSSALLDTVSSSALITQCLLAFDSTVKVLCGQFHCLNESPLSLFDSDIQ